MIPPELEIEIQSHINWFVRHLVKKGHSVKNVDETIKRLVTETRKDQIVDLYLSGMIEKEISEVTGYSPSVVNVAIYAYFESKAENEKFVNNG